MHVLIAHIELSDNGIGFEQSEAEKIFNTFTRLNSKDKFEGTGLGLSLCKKIVLRHGGSISAKGKRNEGSVFFISLPVRQLFQKLIIWLRAVVSLVFFLKIPSEEEIVLQRLHIFIQFIRSSFEVLQVFLLYCEAASSLYNNAPIGVLSLLNCEVACASCCTISLDLAAASFTWLTVALNCANITVSVTNSLCQSTF